MYERKAVRLASQTVASLCMPERLHPHCRLRLTHLGDGGCILGICNSHMLYAGAG